MIYLDSAASSQRPRQVIQAMTDCYEQSYANVHRGTHWLSEEASRLYEQARVVVQKFIGAAWTSEVIFTGGTTDAINTVARSWGDEHLKEGDEILLTLVEHHSNIVPWQQLAERIGATIKFSGITDDGQLDCEDFKSCLSDRTRIVGLSAVSNTLGTIHPVKELVAMAHAAGALVLIDAAQQVPHGITNVVDWNADFVAFSAHKMLVRQALAFCTGNETCFETCSPLWAVGA